MNLNEYLKRIKCEHLDIGANNVASLEKLRTLHENHLLAIPWENFSLAQDDPITMNVERIYDKVIRRQRGGFCFELNQLFAWLLKQLGYEFKLIACRNFMMLQQDFHPWCGHMAILVRFTSGGGGGGGESNVKEYLCDVGHSSSPRYPLEFVPDKIQQGLIGHFRIVNSFF
jgi:arylamine N-acetyltransferase